MNTTVTIEYSNGETRKFVASDKLEEMILNGELFSVTSLYPCDPDIDMKVSKMFAGNPIAALGHMMMMKKNAEGLDDDDVQKPVIIDVLNACITMLSNEISSFKSGMSPITELKLVE